MDTCQHEDPGDQKFLSRGRLALSKEKSPIVFPPASPTPPNRALDLPTNSPLMLVYPSPESRRGLFSCLHSECDDARNSGFQGKGITEALHDLIANFYAEAFGRLPFEGLLDEHLEQLLKAMRRGGICVGLLDPVSNIILNTISVLPRDFQPKRNPRHERRSKRLAGAAQPDYIWSGITRLSYHSLVRFLVKYFGCLTNQQAARYLYWAGADLALAVLLVEHDLYAAEPQLPDPASGRTQAALKCAATCGRHPAPHVLARLHTSPLPQQRLLAAAPFLKPGGRNLTLDDVGTVIESLRYQETALLDLQVNLLPDRRGVVVYCPDEGKLIHSTSSVNNGGSFGVFTIMVERHGDHFASLRGNESASISTFLKNAFKTSQGRISLESCGDACEYTESLRMRLHGMIHALYLKAFAMLPSHVSCRLIRYILFAGHCYGPLEPVSNIIINSIWHSIVFPLPLADSKSEAYDILDTLSMLRVVNRSLKGLIAIVQASSNCSVQRAMEYLCYNCCHLSLEMHTPHGFAAAAKAAKHPQQAALGSFLLSLEPHMLDSLRTLLSTTSGTLSFESIDQVEYILDDKFKETEMTSAFAPKEAELCQVVKDTLLIKRSEYKNLRLFIRSELAKVLNKYASEHPQEPKYVLSVICGVVETYSSDRDTYHVNFVAASESGVDNQLFFAELNVPWQSKPNFCRRLCLIHMGRCYYGQTSSMKIMYPASSDYFECDITSYGIKQTDRMLDADFVFDFRRDQQFADDTVKYCEHQKALSELDDV